MLWRIGGFFVGCLILITLAIFGLIGFIPNAGRYLKIKNM